MNKLRVGVLCAAMGFPLLAGCGSSGTPVLGLSCTTHRLASGMIRATVTVTNSGPSATPATVYGPVFALIRHVYPPSLVSTYVTGPSSAVVSYPGFEIPRLRPGHTVTLILRFAPPNHPQGIAVTETRTLRAGDSIPLSGSSCVIRR